MVCTVSPAAGALPPGRRDTFRKKQTGRNDLPVCFCEAWGSEGPDGPFQADFLVTGLASEIRFLGGIVGQVQLAGADIVGNLLQSGDVVIAQTLLGLAVSWVTYTAPMVPSETPQTELSLV